MNQKGNGIRVDNWRDDNEGEYWKGKNILAGIEKMEGTQGGWI